MQDFYKHTSYTQKIINPFHVAEVWEKLESAGLVKILEKNILQSGAIDYIIQDLVTGKILPTKTVFPPSWTKEKIAEAMWDIYKNGYDDIIEKVHYRKNAIDNFDMSIILKYVDNTNNTNPSGYNIITVLPYIKKRT